jgi:flagellar biosynthesis protein FlhF
MRLKNYRAASVVQAMALIRAELGADALILSSRRVNGGVEIAACLDPQEDLPPPEPLTRYAPPARLTADAPPARPTADAPPARPGDDGPPALRAWPPPAAPRTARSNGAAPPAPDGSLAWHGVPAQIAAQIAARLATADLPCALEATLQFGALPLRGEAPLLLVGAPGAGKTLTTARLATRLVLSGKTPLVISADGRRAGAAEELAAYTRLLGIELIVAHKPATIARALPHGAPGAPVLIDTAGVNPFDPAQIDALSDIAAAAGATPVLVLAAGQDAREAAEQAAIFAAAAVRHLVPTRLDMARRLGALIAAAHEGGMILSEAGTGPGATDGLTPLTARLLAAWLSRPVQLPPARQAEHARHTH